MGGLQGPFCGVLLCAFCLCCPSPRRGASPYGRGYSAERPQRAVDETNQTQAGGGVVSQKVAKFTADDFTA